MELVIEDLVHKSLELKEVVVNLFAVRFLCTLLQPTVDSCVNLVSKLSEKFFVFELLTLKCDAMDCHQVDELSKSRWEFGSVAEEESGTAPPDPKLVIG